MPATQAQTAPSENGLEMERGVTDSAHLAELQALGIAPSYPKIARSVATVQQGASA